MPDTLSFSLLWLEIQDLKKQALPISDALENGRNDEAAALMRGWVATMETLRLRIAKL